MNSTARKLPNIIATLRSGTGLWINAALTGAILGVLAQFIRQIPGVFMTLGASMAPWVVVGFLLAVSAAHRSNTTRKAIFISTGTVAAYLLAWLLLYHLLFVLRESVPFSDGWSQVAPWLVAAIPACPILGTIAALSYRPGLLGDTCLAMPIAWSLPEVLENLKQSWADGAVIVIPVSFLIALLIRMIIAKRRVRGTIILGVSIALGVLAVILFPAFRILIPY